MVDKELLNVTGSKRLEENIGKSHIRKKNVSGIHKNCQLATKEKQKSQLNKMFQDLDRHCIKEYIEKLQKDIS